MPIDPTTPLPLISYQRIMQEPLPIIPWIVTPLFAAGDRNILYGPWGAMKSWILIHLGLHIAAGKPWLGYFAIKQPRSVLYVDEEMSEYVFRRRVQQISHGETLGARDLPFQLLSKAGVTFNREGAINLLEALEQSRFAPDIMIIETLRRVLVGNENEASDIAAFWKNLAPLIQSNIGIILSHHTRKEQAGGKSNVRDRASGSTDIMAGVDSAIAIQPVVSDTVRLEQIKSRVSKELCPFAIRVESHDENGPVSLVLANAPKTPSPPLSEEEEGVRLLKTLFQGQGEDVIRTKNITEYLRTQGLRERTSERAIRLSLQAGHIERVKRGQYRRRPGEESRITSCTT